MPGQELTLASAAKKRGGMEMETFDELLARLESETRSAHRAKQPRWAAELDGMRNMLEVFKEAQLEEQEEDATNAARRRPSGWKR